VGTLAQLIDVLDGIVGPEQPQKSRGRQDCRILGGGIGPSRVLWDLGRRRGEVVSLDLERGRLAVLRKRRSGCEWETLPPE
jgi:hypothetical protein